MTLHHIWSSKMVYFNLLLQNPFVKDEFKNIFSRSGKVSKNKSWELESYKHSPVLFEIYIDTRFTGNDHSGPSIALGLFSYVICARICDNRHWDYENNCWIEHEDRN